MNRFRGALRDLFSDFKEKFVKFITSRATMVGVLMIVCACLLVYRLFYLQIVNGESYLESFRLLIKKEKVIAGTRGNIYDRNGNLLAYNELANSVTIEDVYDTGSSRNSEINATINSLLDILEKNGDTIVSDFNIVIDESGDFSFAVEDTSRLRFLADIYGYASIDDLKYEYRIKNATEVMADMAERFGIVSDEVPISTYSNERLLKLVTVRYNMSLNSYQKYIDTTVASSVCDKTVAEVMENADVLQGVSIVEETARKYVDAEYFSQIIGYTGKVSQDELSELQEQNADYNLNDTVGKAGIEQAMETTLQGKKGSETVYVDKVGKVIETTDYVEPSAGNDLYLTIDKDLQEAAYDILEERLAGILVSKIIDARVAPTTSDSSDLSIPIYDVYFALFNNAVIDTTHFTREGAGETEVSVQEKFLAKKEAVIDELLEELRETKTPYDELSQEFKVYESYIASMLYSDGILNSDAVDKEDATYIAWTTEETISLCEFLHYAIAQDWVNIGTLDLDSKYSDSEEIYEKILAYIEESLSSDVSFGKKMYKYMLDDGIITGKECCWLLLEQGVVTIEDAEYARFEAGNESAYAFMLKRISALDITPAQLNLDPCSGSMVITDVNSGDVLALVSYPSYDNNKMANGVDATYYASLRSDLSRPLYNYATQQKTAPGSTFKPVSATAGLMENVITTTSTISCVGLFDRITPSARCWIYPSAHGALNVAGGIRHSCNYFFYSVGYSLGTENGSYSSELGLEKLAQYADMYGLTEKSGIEIDESEPTISTQDAVRSAIGQGTNSFTTVGLARYVTTVANSGTCYNLTLIDKVTDSSGNLLQEYSASVRNTIDMPSSYWNAIHSGMRGVVEDKSYFSGIGVNVAGKTGTAQERTDRANHALFISYAPYENPEISITTRIANGYSSSYAAQITAAVYQYYYNESDREEIRTGEATTLDGTATSAD